MAPASPSRQIEAWEDEGGSPPGPAAPGEGGTIQAALAEAEDRCPAKTIW